MKKTLRYLPAALLPVLFALLIPTHLQAQNMVSNFNEGFTMNPNADRDVNMVTDFMQALFLDANFDKVRGMMKPDAMDYGPGSADSSTVDQLIQSQQRLDSTVGDWQIHYVARLSIRVKDDNTNAPAGDWVFLWATISAKQKATGIEVNVPTHSVFKIEDGKIALEVDYFDNLSIIRTLGYSVKPPEKSSM